MHLRLPVEEIAINYQANSISGEVDGGRFLSSLVFVSPVTLQQAAPSTQMMNEAIRALMVSYNSCAILDKDFPGQLSEIFREFGAGSEMLHGIEAGLSRTRLRNDLGRLILRELQDVRRVEEDDASRISTLQASCIQPVGAPQGVGSFALESGWQNNRPVADISYVPTLGVPQFSALSAIGEMELSNSTNVSVSGVAWQSLQNYSSVLLAGGNIVGLEGGSGRQSSVILSSSAIVGETQVLAMLNGSGVVSAPNPSSPTFIAFANSAVAPASDLIGVATSSSPSAPGVIWGDALLQPNLIHAVGLTSVGNIADVAINTTSAGIGLGLPSSVHEWDVNVQLNSSASRPSPDEGGVFASVTLAGRSGALTITGAGGSLPALGTQGNPMTERGFVITPSGIVAPADNAEANPDSK